ncbi:protein MEI2-like 4 isoform X2 [Diospyros lotus]|nr:protein MEI2-like 4 isoform X2 [Diospyros lotus]XP_052185129.1 protein MEI2-like 4 isoform X2 [Diospyros lotus]
MDGRIGTADRNSVASSPLGKPMSVESQMVKSFKLPDPYLIQDQKVNLSLEKDAVVSEQGGSHSLWRPINIDQGTKSNLKIEPTSYSVGSEKTHIMGSLYENGLFSSSLSEIFSGKLRLTSNSALHGHSVGAATSHYEEEEPFESLEEIEAQTIGNLLPNDDDLLSGVTDGLDYVPQSNAADDTEDLDLFSSVGGLDLGEDSFPPGLGDTKVSGGHPYCHSGGSISLIYGEHPHGEQPSRTLFIRNINSNVEDSELRSLFEPFGDIRTLYTATKHRGFVMISYYDIRAAKNAMRTLQNKPLRCRKLDIHFSIPKENSSEKDVNQGTLRVYNLDSSVSTEELHQIFGVYGEIKEIHEAPHRGHHKSIEFYDVRAAEAALHALNRTNIAGRQITVEPGYSGDARWCNVMPFPPDIEQDESGLQLQQSPSNSRTGFDGPISHGGITSSGMDNGMQGVCPAIETTVRPYTENMFHYGISSSGTNSCQSSLPESGLLKGQLNIEYQRIPNIHPHSLPEYHDGLTKGPPCNSPRMAANISSRPSERIENRLFGRASSPLELNDAVFGSSGNGSCPPGCQYMWSSSCHPMPQGMKWPNSPTYVNGLSTAHTTPRLHALTRSPSHMLNTILPINNHHLGSAPSLNPSLWDRQQTYAGESLDASGFHPGSLGKMRISGNSPHHLEFVPQNIFPHVGGNCMDMPIASKNVLLHPHHQRCLMFPGRGPMVPMMSSFDLPNERARSRRNESSSNQGDNKKQFELDIDRIMRGEDKRTTLMIKNIPNKYTSKMLLAAIDERHRGTYDFIYLPIDFKNKCNVGYAFINMTDPSLIIPFYQAFNGKKWEKFNSEKVASLAYARIQGKAALIAHFQNSSLMNEDKRCRPILFNTDGPNAGDQVPFPMGVNVRSKSSKTRGMTSDENNEESASNLPKGQESSGGESPSGSAKD